MHEYCLNLICSPTVEEKLLDVLLESDESEIFTSIHVHSHGAEHGQLSAREQVMGRSRAMQIQVLLSQEALMHLLERVQREFAGTGIRYWASPWPTREKSNEVVDRDRNDRLGPARIRRQPGDASRLAADGLGAAVDRAGSGCSGSAQRPGGRRSPQRCSPLRPTNGRHGFPCSVATTMAADRPPMSGTRNWSDRSASTARRILTGSSAKRSSSSHRPAQRGRPRGRPFVAGTVDRRAFCGTGPEAVPGATGLCADQPASCGESQEGRRCVGTGCQRRHGGLRGHGAPGKPGGLQPGQGARQATCSLPRCATVYAIDG